ncbi:hypothetical protein EV174_001512 [Coemansia sp. RSA 2320]|nr:hypothetical protein EV174_001512 [Coemansia sp. RSA 2320]
MAVRSPTAGRPAPRPGTRPVSRPPASPGTSGLSPTAPQSAMPGRPGPLAVSPGGRPAAPPPASATPRPGPALSPVAGDSPLQRQGPEEEPSAEPAAEAGAGSTAGAAAPNFNAPSPAIDEERYLTESVIAACPPLIAPPRGFEPLYGLEGAFRSLCHGVMPSNAEWSSLNILAVTWPQLEVEPTASRRLAQRDIPDVSSMSASDSMRPVEERRPPSSAIHLYRLHVHPPPAWDAGARLRPIQPSLLPLCDLRMQQHWDEQVSRANMGRLVDDFALDGQSEQSSAAQAPAATGAWPCGTVNVSPLSGWHGGTSQVGAGEPMRVASAPRCAWSTDCRMLATGDRAGRFEIFQLGAELNSWHSVYHVDFDYPVIACLWIANQRKYGISRRPACEPTERDKSPSTSAQAASTSALPLSQLSEVTGPPPREQPADAAGANPHGNADCEAFASSDSPRTGSWDVDPTIFIRRLPFFGPRNTQGEYALVVLTADGQLVLIYQRDEKWARVVSPLEPQRRDLRPGLHRSGGTGTDGADASTLDASADDPDTDMSAADANADAGSSATAPGQVGDKSSSDMDDPWSNIPNGLITHADMMLVSKKWIYVAAHRAGAAPVKYPHEPGAILEELKHDGRILAPTVEVYRIQVEFASDYSPRLFAMPLVVQPITLLPGFAAMGASAMEVDSDSRTDATDDTTIPRLTHLKLITALNPEVRLVETNILGEQHYFPLLFVSLGKLEAGRVDPGPGLAAAAHDAHTTFIQVWRLEGAPHAQKSVVDLLRRPPPLKLTHMWTESRKGLLLSVIANRAERQQLRYLFAKPSDKDYRALMLTWADGKVEMLRNYQDHDSNSPSTDCFDQCVLAVPSSSECVIGSVLSPHYTAYFQLVMRPWTVELGKRQGDGSPRGFDDGLSTSAGATLAADASLATTEKTRNANSPNDKVEPDTAVACLWSQRHARFRLGWTPFFGDLPLQPHLQPQPSTSVPRPLGSLMNAHVQAYCGDLFAVRVLNKEDPTDLIAILANMATYEENQPLPEHQAKGKHAVRGLGAKEGESKPGGNEPHGDSGAQEVAEGTEEVLSVPSSRTLSQALFRACTLLANALGITSLELDPLSSTTPYVRRLLGAIMQIHFLAQHNIQATSLGLLLHIASVVEARVTTIHDHILQKVTANQNLFDIAESFSDKWQRTFPSTAALVLWCIDLFVALIRDTYLYLNVRCADGSGSMKRLCELDTAVASLVSREMSYLLSFRGAADVDGAPGEPSDACLLPGGLPSRLALIFHRPTLEALRSLMTFVAQLEMDLLRRIQILNSLPHNAAAIPEYANMVRSRDMVVSTAQQLAHALEYLPVSMQRMKDFLSEVRDMYSADGECTSLSAQTILASTSTVTGPFRKYLPQVARCFSRFILEPEPVNASISKPASPSALVLHDTRWMNVVMCRSNILGLPDSTAVFETPWCVKVPVTVMDPRLIEADEDALVPAAELAEWEKEKSEFERALDEDNVLFDIDDPGFIFFDNSGMPGSAEAEFEAGFAPAQHSLQPTNTPFVTLADAIAGSKAQQQPEQVNTPMQSEYSRAILFVASKAAAQAPVSITTRAPDFSDVLDSCIAKRDALADVDVDYMFNTPLLFDSMHGHSIGADLGASSGSSGSLTWQSCTTPRANGAGSGYSWTRQSIGSSDAGQAHAFRKRTGNAQHFAPHYPNASLLGTSGDEQLSSGWQFISTPRDPTLHIPTLLAQHAYSLAVLHQKRLQQRQAQNDPANCAHNGGDNDDDCDGGVSYCIDWSRSDGIVVESSPSSGLSSLAVSAVGGHAASNGMDTGSLAAHSFGRHQKQLEYMSNGSVDRVDVVQKIMLPSDARVKMCLRCGHVTRRETVSINTGKQCAGQDLAQSDGSGQTLGSATVSPIGWIGRFGITCVCGGSWITL